MKKPTDDEIAEFIDMFGDLVPDPNQYPKMFAYYWNSYRFLKEYPSENLPR